MLNPEFAQPGWQPDVTLIYACSPWSKTTGFTYLMSLVLSGRNHQGCLSRQSELDAFLITPESSDACRQTNSIGMTALMLAAANSRADSTDATVAQLLAHESSSEVARMQNEDGETALILAAWF
jgi:ankyrin repeat protein